MILRIVNAIVNVCLMLLTIYHILFDKLPWDVTLLLCYLLFLILLCIMHEIYDE